MSEQIASQPSAPQPVVQTAGQPVVEQPSVPNTQSLPYSPDQVSSWKRQAEQYNGARPLIDTLVQSGVKTQEQLQSTLGLVSEYRQIDEQLTARGLDRNALRNLLSGPQVQQQAQPPAQAVTPDVVAKVVAEQFQARDLQAAHTAGVQAESQAFTRAVDEIAAGAPPEFRKIAETLLRTELDNSAPLYPEGHPYAGKYLRPVDPQTVQTVASQVKSTLMALRGQQAVQQAQAAIAQVATGGGAFQTGAGQAQAEKPFYQRTAAEQEAIARQAMQAAMGKVTGQPVSQT